MAPSKRHRSTNRTGIDVDRRQELIDAAAAVFYEKGFSASSIQDVANRVGMLKGSIYHYVASKEALLLEILTQTHQALFEDLGAELEASSDAAEQLRRIVTTMVLGMRRDLPKAAVFIREFRSLSPDSQASIRSVRDKYDRLVIEVLDRGRRDGTFREDLDPRLAAFAVLGLVNSCVQWYQPTGAWGPEKIAEAFGDILLEGLGAPRLTDTTRLNNLGRAVDDAKSS